MNRIELVEKLLEKIKEFGEDNGCNWVCCKGEDPKVIKNIKELIPEGKNLKLTDELKNKDTWLIKDWTTIDNKKVKLYFAPCGNQAKFKNKRPDERPKAVVVGYCVPLENGKFYEDLVEGCEEKLVKKQQFNLDDLWSDEHFLSYKDLGKMLKEIGIYKKIGIDDKCNVEKELHHEENKEVKENIFFTQLIKCAISVNNSFRAFDLNKLQDAKNNIIECIKEKFIKELDRINQRSGFKYIILLGPYVVNGIREAFGIKTNSKTAYYSEQTKKDLKKFFCERNIISKNGKVIILPHPSRASQAWIKYWLIKEAKKEINDC